MAHFAKLNSDNIVVRVSVVNNEKLMGEDGTESEANGISYLEQHGAADGFQWKQTSYNTGGGKHTLGGTPFRKNYAGIGYTYDSDRDAFISPKPFDNWLFDETTCTWEHPVPRPEGNYIWSEQTQAWYLWDEQIGR